MLKNKLKFVSILFAILFILFVIEFYFLSTSSLDDTTEKQNILSLSIEFLSLISTVILSIITILQTKKINTIEKNEYDFFIAVKEIDETIELGENFIVPHVKFNTNFLKELRFSITHSIYNNKIVYLTFINLSERVNVNNIQIIPLKIITKNKLLITEIYFEQIDICVKYDNSKDVFCKSLKGFSSTLSGIYDNESTIPLVLGLCLPQTLDNLCTIDLKIFIQIKDQYKNALSYILKNEILCNGQGSFLINSSTYKSNK